MRASTFKSRTVGCIYNTRRGTLYQLSEHNQALTPINSVQINLPEFLDKKYVFELVEEQKIGFRKYLNMDHYENYLTIYNSNSQKKILGTSREDAIKLFLNGYKELSIYELIKFAELCKPDVLVSFAEVPNITDSGQKSNKRAIAKNVYFLEKTIEQFKPHGTLVLAPIIATKFNELLEESIASMQKLEPDGYVIQGLHQGETFEQRDLVYQTINQAFVGQSIKEKKLVLSSAGEPSDILHAIYNGIYLFEAEYPFRCAEKGEAVALNLAEFQINETKPEGVQEDIHGKPLDKSVFQQGLKARVMDLNSKEHKLILKPLLENCECYTCKNHTQAYIHHLLECDEMTANVLLTLHNVHNYQQFIDALQQNEERSTLHSFIQWFMDTQCVVPPSSAETKANDAEKNGTKTETKTETAEQQ